MPADNVELVDVHTNDCFSVLASDEFARFLDGLVRQTEDRNQSRTTEELIHELS